MYSRLAAALLVVKAHDDHVTQILYINSLDKVVSASRDRRVCLLDPVSKECNYFYGHTKSVECVCFVSEYSYMASSGQEREIQVLPASLSLSLILSPSLPLSSSL